MRARSRIPAPSSPTGRILDDEEAINPDDDMEYEERRLEDPAENEDDDDDLSPTDVVTPRGPAANAVSSSPPRVVPYVKMFCDGTGKGDHSGAPS